MMGARRSWVQVIGKYCSIMLCAVLVVLMLPISASAEKNTEESAAGAEFSVSTVIPDNQVDKSRTYFDLQMQPEQEQTLEIELKNYASEEIKIQTQIHSAITNINGVVDYSKEDAELDESLKYDMKDIISADEFITIPADATYVLELKVEMPEEEFDGVLAGGITLKQVAEEDEEEKDEDDSGQMTIQNKYAYVVGVVLRENDVKITPQLELEKVFPNQVNARNVISSTIRNIEPMYMNRVEVDAEITAKGSDDILYSTYQTDMQMAPNSNFDFPLYLEGAKMQAGEYTMHMTVRSMGEEWNWEQDFTITSEEAKRFNEADVTIPEEDNTWLYILAGAAVLLIVLVVIVIIRSRKKTALLKKQLEEATNGKS